jgi:2-methylcitrate dehydratase PrpD
MTLTEDLADAILKTPRELDRLPVAATVRHVVDTLGCHYFGTTLGFPLALLDEVTSRNGPCSVFGTGRKASPTDAALANATLQSAFELDSGGSFVHPGPCVLPAVFAVAELAPTAPGRAALLRAIAIGYETSVRVAEWVGFVPEKEIGWHTPSFHGAIGGAAAAGALIDLDPEPLAHGLAFAADMAGGGLIHSRNNSKRFHTARAAQTAVMAVLLARRGLRAGLGVLEDPRWGYRRAMTYSGEGPVEIPQPDAADVLHEFGEQWRAFDRLGMKYYPFHSAGQTILDNCRALVLEHGVRPADVASVRIGLTSFMYGHDTMLVPATDIGDANFCLPFAAAVGLLRHPPRLTETRDASIAPAFVRSVDDPDIKRLEALVSFEVAPELDDENPYTMDTVVTVTRTDGSTATSRTTYGHAARARGGTGGIGFAPSSDDGIATKFLNLTEPALGREPAERLLAAITGEGDLLTALRQSSGR